MNEQNVLREAPIHNKHLNYVKEFYNDAPAVSSWTGKQYRRILARYFKKLIPRDASVLEVGCGNGELLSHLPNSDITGIDLSEKQVAEARRRLPRGKFHVQAGESISLDRQFDTIILSDTINFAADVQRIFERLHAVSHSKTRLILNFHNAVWRPVLGIATWLGLKEKHPPSNWLSDTDVRNLLVLAGWEPIKQQERILFPLPILGLHRVCNRFLALLAPWICLTIFQIARSSRTPPLEHRSVSVIIPARNEAGNIATAVRRIPKLGIHTELIFIEGHSKDDTLKEIRRTIEDNPHLDIKLMQQSGKGKGNAVREAFEAATGDILMILDADLTMPPEELTKFYDLLISGKAEFANGVRLVYPMEKQAMRFLNLFANKLFSLAFSWVLDQPIKDTLCGTKALFREDYQCIARNRGYFGDFDPFGDFDLLFGASRLHLKIADIPIRYCDRTYGTTNIRRWKHGLLLFNMLILATKKLKLI